MSNQNLPALLEPIKLSLDDLLLDPNNPRFSALGEELHQIAESRFADEKVQSNAFEKMRHQSFDVAELRDTMKAIGFLPMDRIVVRKWRGGAPDARVKYLVIEGNRRVTALKWLVHLHEVGKETFTEAQLKNFTDIEGLLLDDAVAGPVVSLILPGLRHVSGVKEWGPYQKAKAVHALRKSGLSPQETAQSLGLSTRAANAAYRCFIALENMKADEEFGDYAEPKMYSYFEEVLKRPNVKSWLGWSDDKESFEQVSRLTEFYSWIVPDQDESGGTPKLPEAKSVRELSQIVEDENALNILRGSDGSLAKALARYEVDHPEDWYPKITAAVGAMNSLTPEMLRKMDGASVAGLNDIIEVAQRVLKDRELLKSR